VWRGHSCFLLEYWSFGIPLASATAVGAEGQGGGERAPQGGLCQHPEEALPATEGVCREGDGEGTGAPELYHSSF